MANKNVYQTYNDDALKHFGLEDEPTFGLITSNQIDNVLITQDVTTFEKIHNLLGTESLSSTEFQSLKRGFILPKCPTSQDRIKAACKEHSITITNDYEKADFIITHDEFKESFRNGEKIKIQTLMYKLWNYQTTPGTSTGDTWLDNLIKGNCNEVIVDEKFEDGGIAVHRCESGTDLMDEWGLPGLALNLAYLVDTNEMEVLNVETLLHSSANITELNETLVNELTTWIDSYDTDNLAVAAKILPTIDYTKKPHLMWQLAQNINGRMYNFNREKDVQYWMDQSELSTLYHNSAEEMILKLEEEGKLCNESFKYLERIVRKDISIHNRELYVFKVSVKKEYRKFLQ